MSESATAPGIKSAGSFASLLESFTSPAKNSNQTWDDTSLLDDVATISYEQALRTHRRVPPVAALPITQPPSAMASAGADASPAALGKKRKCASVTIRLTDAEQTQLHERAAEAQLSVSAYLRSCIFEAESLRTQVKEALSQIRTAHADPSPRLPSLAASSWRNRLLPHWRRSPSA